MKVLYITNKPPFPTVDGGCFAMANFMKILHNANVDILHYTLSTSKHPFDSSKYPENAGIKQILNHYVDTDVNAFKALPYLFNTKSYNIERFHNKEVEEEIIQCLRSNEVDHVILESLYTTTYFTAIRKVFKGKVFVRTHNVESDIWKDYSSQASGIKKAYLSKLQRDLLKYETQILNKVDGLLTISREDQNRFKELGINTPSAVINIGIALNDSISLGNNLYFLGAMDWQPNIEAVQYLLGLFPEIRSKAPDLSLYIAGKGSEEKFSPQEGANIMGFVEDLEQFYEMSGILVSPVFSGSGIRVKILEAMANGVPVISSSKGAQGINYKDSGCIRIAETKEEIAAACIELHASEAKRIELGNKAKAYIRSYHDEQQIAIKLIEFINKS